MNYNCSICNSESEKVMEFEKTDIFKCKVCSHYFSKNIKISPEEVYSTDYFLQSHKNFFKYPDISLYKKIENSIKKDLSKDANILDMGCGTGNFLKFLKDKDYKNLYGVDFIENNNEIINFMQADLFDYNPTIKFDVIVSNMNIEHIEDLDKYIKKIESLLNDNGVIIINTINEHSLIYLLSKFLYKLNIKFVSERLYDSHHVNHFSISSLGLLFKNYNYKTTDKIIKSYPIKSVDVPENKLYYIQKAGVYIVFLISNLLNMGISQTQFFKKERV